MAHGMTPELRMSTGTRSEPDEDEPTSARGGGDDAFPLEDDFVPRRDTLLRVLLSLLFVVIAGIVETLLAVIVVFELAVALVTERPPSTRVRELANRIVSYYYRIGRYLTYNESRIPFPFDELPEPVEPDAFRADDSEARALGLSESESGSEPASRDER